jgi:hypothetical protein
MFLYIETTIISVGMFCTIKPNVDFVVKFITVTLGKIGSNWSSGCVGNDWNVKITENGSQSIKGGELK